VELSSKTDHLMERESCISGAAEVREGCGPNGSFYRTRSASFGRACACFVR
jgi:hypothetical protein